MVVNKIIKNFLKNFLMDRFFLKEEKGFTLIEVMVSIFVVIIGIAGVYSISSKIISDINLVNLRTTASFLAQEGIEIVKNIRDSNALMGGSWLDGLIDDDDDYKVYKADYRIDYPTNNLSTYDDSNLLISKDGFYSYNCSGGCDSTKFKRKIIIEKKPNDDEKIKVSVIVSWPYKGRTEQIKVEQNLYNLYGF